MERRLQQALEREEFFLAYQPQINIKTGEISGLEALIRWQHPQKGSISPGLFLPLIEKTSFTLDLSEWVLKTACQQNHAWQQAGLPMMPVTVNLSPRQFHNPELSTILAQVLRQTELAPQWLELDITEKALLQDANAAQHTLQSLQEMGVHLCLDDFGTGYASLNCLSQFPFGKLKIAQSYIRKLVNKPQDKALILAAIAWGQSLNLKVVAEGVETQEQFELLRYLQCQEMQGYWFNRPLAAGEIVQVLAKRGSSLQALSLSSGEAMMFV